jgi:hypothetical protein
MALHCDADGVSAVLKEVKPINATATTAEKSHLNSTGNNFIHMSFIHHLASITLSLSYFYLSPFRSVGTVNSPAPLSLV